MAWNYDDEEVNGVIDSNIKDSPPNPPGVNTSATMRSMLKNYWAVIRNQVSAGVNGVDVAITQTLDSVEERVSNTETAVNQSLNQTLADVETRVSAAEELAESIHEQFLLADGLGTYNASANQAIIRDPASTFTPVIVANQASGKYFNIDVEGTQNITGTSTLMKVGGVLISRGSKWDYVPPVDTGYQKALALEDIVKTTDAGETQIGDKNGYVIAKFKADGTLQILELQSNLITVGNAAQVAIKSDGQISVENGGKVKFGLTEMFNTDQYDEIHYDNNGYIGFVRYLDGTVKMDTSLLVTPTKRVNKSGFLADINHFLNYGQSLSEGGTTIASLVSSRTQSYNSLMFFGGVRPWKAAAETRYSSLIPLVESTEAETPASGIANIITETVATEQGHNYNDPGWSYQVLVSCPGLTGKSVLDLSKGSIYYARLLEDVTNGLALANAAGKTFNVPALSWIQGEQDSGGNPTIYKQNLIKLRDDINTDIKAITKQENDVLFVVYQVASHNATMATDKFPVIGLAHYELATEVEGFDLGAVMYPLEYQPDGIHLINTSSLIMGLYQGYRMKQNVIDGVFKNFVRPVNYTAQGNIIDIEFHVPVAPLVFDTGLVSDPGHYGFRIYNNLGVEVAITSIAVTRHNTVRIVAASTVISGFKVTYAINGTGSGRTNGSRGCLRDSQGTQVNYNKGGVAWDLHNWCPIFQKTF